MKKKSTGNRTATDVVALAATYYDKAMLANLKSATPFMRAFWECCCGKPAEHEVQVRKGDKRFKRRWETITLPVCEACKFRYTVMKAAGREVEFVEEYKKQKDALEKEPIDILKRKPLPARSGKTIQMYQYKSLIQKP